MKRVSCFSEVEIDRVEYISFFDKKGNLTHAIDDKKSLDIALLDNTAISLYAFINMLGGEFIIVDRASFL